MGDHVVAPTDYRNTAFLLYFLFSDSLCKDFDLWAFAVGAE